MPRLRWQQAEGRRHAYNTEKAAPHPGISFPALCGAEVIPRERDFIQLAGWWHDPTCWSCDREWRILADFPSHDIPPLPENA